MGDKIIVCVDCGGEFTFTESEQKFFAEKNFSEPKRCKECRQAVKKSKGEKSGGGDRRGGSDNGNRPSFEVVCADCGKKTTVPFEPRGDRPVYCRDCYKNRK